MRKPGLLESYTIQRAAFLLCKKKDAQELVGMFVNSVEGCMSLR